MHSAKSLQIFCAPVQGHTDAVWRHYHAEVFGGIDRYFTPFMHVENGCVRRRDLTDANSTLNIGIDVVPQIIFRDQNEFMLLTDELATAGHVRIDLNLGCPFPPQMKRGRGAAMINRIDMLSEICSIMSARTDVAFSIKMRPGKTNAEEWLCAADIINKMPLESVTIHPRIASMGYKGATDKAMFTRMSQVITHPIIYNGDLSSPDDINIATATWPSIKGVMIGRGLLAHPWIALEWKSGITLSPHERIDGLRRMHDGIYRYYTDTLCGDTQILSKIKPFWEYLEDTVGHKTCKTIAKSGSKARYESAVAAAWQ